MRTTDNEQQPNNAVGRENKTVYGFICDSDRRLFLTEETISYLRRTYIQPDRLYSYGFTSSSLGFAIHTIDQAGSCPCGRSDQHKELFFPTKQNNKEIDISLQDWFNRRANREWQSRGTILYHAMDRSRSLWKLAVV